MEQQGSEITPDQIKDSEAQMVRLRGELDKAKTDNEVTCAYAALELADRSHRQLCAQQAAQLQQIYMQAFLQRMRSN